MMITSETKITEKFYQDLRDFDKKITKLVIQQQDRIDKRIRQEKITNGHPLYFVKDES